MKVSATYSLTHENKVRLKLLGLAEGKPASEMLDRIIEALWERDKHRLTDPELTPRITREIKKVLEKYSTLYSEREAE